MFLGYKALCSLRCPTILFEFQFQKDIKIWSCSGSIRFHPPNLGPQKSGMDLEPRVDQVLGSFSGSNGQQNHRFLVVSCVFFHVFSTNFGSPQVDNVHTTLMVTRREVAIKRSSVLRPCQTPCVLWFLVTRTLVHFEKNNDLLICKHHQGETKTKSFVRTGALRSGCKDQRAPWCWWKNEGPRCAHS